MNFTKIILVGLLGFTLVEASDALAEVSERFPVVILPVEETSISPEFLEINEIAANVLVSEAVNLGRFDVYDRNKVQEILQEHALRLSVGEDEESNSSSLESVDSLNLAPKASPLVSQKKWSQKSENEIEELDTWAMLQASTSSRKAFRVAVTHLNQKGVANEDRGFLGALFVSQEELESNIETEVEVQFDLVDISTNETLNSFTYEGSHTGGNRAQSLTAALQGLNSKLKRELQNLFSIKSFVQFDSEGRPFLKFDEDIGVQKGNWFKFHVARRPMVIHGDTFQYKPRSFALAQVTEVHDNFAILEFRREWGEPSENVFAQEMNTPPVGLSVFYSKSQSEHLADVGFDFLFTPLDLMSGVVRLQAGNVDAPRGLEDDTESAFHTALGLGASVKFDLNQKFALRALSLAEFNLLHKGDDSGNLTSAFAFSVPLQVDLEFALFAKGNLSIGVGQRFFGKSLSWNYSEAKADGESITIPATWDKTKGAEPEVDLSGTFFRVGYTWIIF